MVHLVVRCQMKRYITAPKAQVHDLNEITRSGNGPAKATPRAIHSKSHPDARQDGLARKLSYRNQFSSHTPADDVKRSAHTRRIFMAHLSDGRTLTQHPNTHINTHFHTFLHLQRVVTHRNTLKTHTTLDLSLGHGAHMLWTPCATSSSTTSTLEPSSYHINHVFRPYFTPFCVTT